ncbi:MAG: hypothetical protein LBM38_06460 [Clostridiales bacterium]|jgi:hypothetical protein|nr:hypothetical protein [Clostridiales bacterium]
MVKDMHEYISFDIFEYLKEIERIVPRTLDFTFQQTLGFIFPNIFMKMTGCLEHKLDMVSIQLCIDHENYKQNKLRKSSKIPEGSSEYETIIKELLENVNGLGGANKYILDLENINGTVFRNALWKDIEVWDSVINRLFDWIDSPLFSCYFKNNSNKCKHNCEISEVDTMIEKSANRIGDSLVKTKYRECPLKYLFDMAFRFRNKFAHNENSVYLVEKTPLGLRAVENEYDNWWIRFAILLYADEILRESFKKYLFWRRKRHLI